MQNRIIATVLAFCVGVVLLPILPLGLAVIIWNEFDEGWEG